MTLVGSAAQLITTLSQVPWLLPGAAEAIAQMPGPIAVPFSLACMEVGQALSQELTALGHAIRESHITQLEREIPTGPHLRRQYRVLTLGYPAKGGPQPIQWLGQISICTDREADGINVHFHRDDESEYGWRECVQDMVTEMRDCPAAAQELLWSLPGALSWRVAMSLHDMRDSIDAREALFEMFMATGANRCRAMPHSQIWLQSRCVRAHKPHLFSDN